MCFVRSASGSLLTSGFTTPQKARPECISDSTNFDAKVKVLQEQIEHHVEEEEGDLFLKVRANFAAQELSLMGEKMEESFEALIQTSPRNQVPNETDQAAPLT